MKAVIKYPGSKWSIADWIIKFFPEHHSYLEPFFGSGAVLFNKPRSHIETVNDLDGNVVNLFEWIKRDPERLAHEIYFTPHGKQYRCEMDDAAQSELLDVSLVHKGPVLISGYDNNLYNDRLKGWHKEYTTCYSQSRSKKQEILWMNFEPQKQMDIYDILGQHGNRHAGAGGGHCI